MNLTYNKKIGNFLWWLWKGPAGGATNGPHVKRTEGDQNAIARPRGTLCLPRNEILNADGPSGPAPFLAPAPRQLRTALVIKKDRWKKYISIYINIFPSQKCCVPLRNFEFSQKYCIPKEILHCFAKHFAKHLHSLAKVLCFLLHSLTHKTLAFSCKTIAFLQETLRLIGKTFAFNGKTLHSLAK